MRIGLIDIEPKIFNTAYMQIASYHKSQGDTVNWWMPLIDEQFDKIYCSSIFDFTDTSEVPARAYCGGSGFDVRTKLPDYVEQVGLDYSIYPKCDRSIVWFSRGCNRNCPWCIVYDKEGRIRPVVPKNLNPNGKYITVNDNSFFSNPLWELAITRLCDWGQPVDIQGIDIRTTTDLQCRALLSLKHHKQIKFAWDDVRDEQAVLLGIERMLRYFKPYKLMCYVLIGFWHGQEDADLHRVETLRKLGITPFVMPFDRRYLYQRAFARWVNHRAIFMKVPWKDYLGNVTESELKGDGWSKGT